MREILFRGKMIDFEDRWQADEWNGWIYGSLLERHGVNQQKIHGLCAEYQNASVSARIDPQTVGQFTGLTDKNGTKIFEGDIVFYRDEYYEIVYLEKYMRFVARKPNTVFAVFVMQNVEIVGNIHDNPELLRATEDDNENATQDMFLSAT